MMRPHNNEQTTPVFELKGKTAIVIGDASGIGDATAPRLSHAAGDSRLTASMINPTMTIHAHMA